MYVAENICLPVTGLFDEEMMLGLRVQVMDRSATFVAGEAETSHANRDRPESRSSSSRPMDTKTSPWK